MISFFILYISFHFLLCGMHASTKMVPLALCAAAVTRRFGSVNTLTKNHWLFSMGFSQFENDNSKKYKLFFLPLHFFFTPLHSVHYSIHVDYG